MNLSIGMVVSVVESRGDATLELVALGGAERTFIKTRAVTDIGKEGDILAYHIPDETDFIYNLTDGTYSKPATRYLDRAMALALLAAFLTLGLMLKLSAALAICSLACILVHFLYERLSHRKKVRQAQYLAGEYQSDIERSQGDRKYLPAA
ncbi:hypothetical protein LCM08_14740 [Salipiger pacificus]|nr:hypothetical protein [Alloyangia pacifica]MCA0946173.1 hypothetical protein [Alloyangia pacifica]